ncbi:MAG: ParA family protein [Ruminococcaceae bacterium]|nr:ParA family protein [Oscillospiraceae bacterium]
MSKTKVIAIANQKGGVGKTTTALNVAAGLVKAGKKVMVIDLDPQGNLTNYIGHEPDELPTISELLQQIAVNQLNSESIRQSIRTNVEAIDYIPSNILLGSADVFLANVVCREQVLRRLLRDDVFSTYDYILIDCLPGLGILLTNALSASTSVLIPVQAQKFAYDGLQQLEQIYTLVKENINPSLEIEGVLITLVENTTMARAVEDALIERYGDKVYRSKIRRLVEAPNSTYVRKSLIATKSSKLGAEYQAVVDEMLGN